MPASRLVSKNDWTAYIIHWSHSHSPRSTRRLWSDPPPVQRYRIVWTNDQRISCMRLALAPSNMRTETKCEGKQMGNSYFFDSNAHSCEAHRAVRNVEYMVPSAACIIFIYHRLNVRVHHLQMKWHAFDLAIRSTDEYLLHVTGHSEKLFAQHC